MSDKATTTTDRWIQRLKDRRIVAVIVIAGIALAGGVAGVSQLKTVAGWFRGTPELELAFEITNNSPTAIELFPSCDIAVYEDLGATWASYPKWSRSLSCPAIGDDTNIPIPVGASVVVKTSVPIDDSNEGLFKRATGTLVIAFETTDREHRFDTSWKFCEKLGHIGPLRINAFKEQEAQQSAATDGEDAAAEQ